MKNTLYTLLAIALVFTPFQSASADVPAPGGPFATAFRVQNLETLAASCSYYFYDAAGTAAYTSSLTTIQPGDSMFVYTPNLTGLANGIYSGVVSCDKEVAAVVNFSDTNSGASHNGIAVPGITWYVPNLFDNYYSFYTTVVVQNAAGVPVNITMEIYAPGSSTAVKTQSSTSVPVYASVSFEQEGLAELNPNVAYSAKITATGGVAPIVVIYGRAASNDQLYSYNPVQAGSTTVYAPVIMNNYYGYNTSLTVQNIGAQTTHVTVTYGTGQTQSADIAANSSQLFYSPSSGIPSGNTLGNNSATIVSTSAGFGAQPIVAVVNESDAHLRAASYVGFAAGGTEVRLPIVYKRYYKYNTSVTCQVISGGPATMTIEYFGSGGVSLGTTTSPSKSNGQQHLFYQPNESYLANGYGGSAVVTSAAQIACIVNENQNEAPEATMVMDQLFAYEGIVR